MAFGAERRRHDGLFGFKSTIGALQRKYGDGLLKGRTGFVSWKLSSSSKAVHADTHSVPQCTPNACLVVHYDNLAKVVPRGPAREVIQNSPDNQHAWFCRNEGGGIFDFDEGKRILRHYVAYDSQYVMAEQANRCRQSRECAPSGIGGAFAGGFEPRFPVAGRHGCGYRRSDPRPG